MNAFHGVGVVHEQDLYNFLLLRSKHLISILRKKIDIRFYVIRTAFPNQRMFICEPEIVI